MARDGGPEPWEELAELASQEQDPEKLIELVAEIDRLLEAKDNHANGGSAAVSPEIAQFLKQEEQAPFTGGSNRPFTGRETDPSKDGSTKPDKPNNLP